MKTFTYIILSLSFVSIVGGTTYFPEDAPSITVEKAVLLAKTYAENNLKGFDTYYVDRVWIGRIPGNKLRTWIVSFANPESGYFFVTVSMKGETGVPDKEVYTQNPFLTYELKPNQNDNK